MSAPLATSPITLVNQETPLFRLVQDFLKTDTDPVNGLIAALGAGADSIYPNFSTAGPSTDRAVCPTPFLVVVPGGKRALGSAPRELKVYVEIHDDLDHGDQRWPGIVERLIQFLIVKPGLRLQDSSTDRITRYITGMYFEEQSPPNLPDARYETQLVQLILACRALDRSSNHGYNG